MGFPADNRTYESWLRSQCQVVEEDLAYKHELMRQNAFVSCARPSRWARRIEETCPDLADAAKVLAIGDLHVENSAPGGRRRSPGRGVNDFDEGAVTPYVFDLVRLATSARLRPTVCSAIERLPPPFLKATATDQSPAGPAGRAGNLDA